MALKFASTCLALLLAALSPALGAVEAFAPTAANGHIDIAKTPSSLSLPMGMQQGIAAPLEASAIVSPAIGPLSDGPVETGIARPTADAAHREPAPAAYDGAKEIARAVSRPDGSSTPGAQVELNHAFDGAGFDKRPSDSAGASRTASASELASSLPLKGRKLILVGTMTTRKWILDDVLEYGRRTGLEVYLVDTNEHRAATSGLIDDAHFLEAEVDSHDPAVMADVTARIADFAGKVGFTKEDRVRTYLNPMAELTSMAVDKLGVFGNGLAVIGAAHTKSKAREIFALDPELAVAYEVLNKEAPKSRAEEALMESKVRLAFRRVAASGKSHSVVLKPIRGAGSALVIVDVTDEEKAVAAWSEINAGLLDTGRKDRKFDTIDHYPGVIMEYQFDGIEVDMEVLRNAAGKDDALMMDNPPMDPPYAVEKGLTVPSQLPDEIMKEGHRIASKALDALGYKVGNAHVEMKYSTLDKRWYILEINARMGGGPVKPLVESVTDVNLIWEDLNAHFGLPAFKTLRDAAGRVGEAWMLPPKVSGTIESVEGLEKAARMTGIVLTDWFKEVGDAIKAAPDDMFDYFGMIHAVGKDYPEAFDRVLAAARHIKYAVRTADGRLVAHTGDEGRAPVDTAAALKGAGKP